MVADRRTVHSRSGIYTATCRVDLAPSAQRYIDALDGKFAVLEDCFGAAPLIRQYHVEIGDQGTWYSGSGRIAMLEDDPNLFREEPACFDGGLLFESIHGFLEPLRHPPSGLANPRIGENRLGEAFSTIVEIAFLERIGAAEIARRYERGHGMGAYHQPLRAALVEIYQRHGVEIYQRLFREVERESTAGRLALDVARFGQEDKAPYTPDYMSRLGDLFHAASEIDVKPMLLTHART